MTVEIIDRSVCLEMRLARPVPCATASYSVLLANREKWSTRLARRSQRFPFAMEMSLAQHGPAYPRDMIGYGRRPPNAAWPGGARVAVQFVINYEEGGENNILHGDAASEAFLSEIIGAAPFAGQRHMNMESIYEYGSRAGLWRLAPHVHRTPNAGHRLCRRAWRWSGTPKR